MTSRLEKVFSIPSSSLHGAVYVSSDIVRLLREVGPSSKRERRGLINSDRRNENLEGWQVWILASCVNSKIEEEKIIFFFLLWNKFKHVSIQWSLMFFFILNYLWKFLEIFFDILPTILITIQDRWKFIVRIFNHFDVVATECQYYNFIIRFGNDYSLSKAVINVLRINPFISNAFLMH